MLNLDTITAEEICGLFDKYEVEPAWGTWFSPKNYSTPSRPQNRCCASTILAIEKLGGLDKFRELKDENGAYETVRDALGEACVTDIVEAWDRKLALPDYKPFFNEVVIASKRLRGRVNT